MFAWIKNAWNTAVNFVKDVYNTIFELDIEDETKPARVVAAVVVTGVLAIKGVLPLFAGLLWVPFLPILGILALIYMNNKRVRETALEEGPIQIIE